MTLDGRCPRAYNAYDAVHTKQYLAGDASFTVGINIAVGRQQPEQWRFSQRVDEHTSTHSLSVLHGKMLPERLSFVRMNICYICI